MADPFKFSKPEETAVNRNTTSELSYGAMVANALPDAARVCFTSGI